MAAPDCEPSDNCVGDGLYFDAVIDGNWYGDNFHTPLRGTGEIALRMERRGEFVRGLVSYDTGMTWYEVGTHQVPAGFHVNAVGLTADQDFYTPEVDYPARFDYFELAEGGGFLPEGFHDGDQGDGPAWACNANGWAVDPDDRAARLNIEVVVDDQTVANLTADQFRQDLQDIGACEGGNCGFSTSLWDLISSYEPHRVDTWAQDSTSGEWFLLSGSEKTLTCRTQDIYAFDAKKGVTVQLTNLRDRG